MAPTETAGTLETWLCEEEYGSDDVLVIANVNKGRKMGSIKVAGIEHQTAFQVKGFERRWDFGPSYEYAFVIRPNGSAFYYDFSSSKKRVKPSIFMTCKTK